MRLLQALPERVGAVGLMGSRLWLRPCVSRSLLLAMRHWRLRGHFPCVGIQHTEALTSGAWHRRKCETVSVAHLCLARPQRERQMKRVEEFAGHQSLVQQGILGRDGPGDSQRRSSTDRNSPAGGS
jgi:hypothetical protein